jgi:YHS domain-containing protein
MKIYSKKDYQIECSRYKKNDTLNPLKKIFIELSEKNVLFNNLKNLSIEKKQEIILYIMLGDGKKAFKKMEESGINKDSLNEIKKLKKMSSIDKNYFYRILESKNDTNYFNEISLKLINILTFDLSMSEKSSFFKKIIKGCPDSEIGLKAKKEMLMEIDNDLAIRIPDPGYDETISNLDTNYIAKIETIKIKNILSNVNINQSEFIVLTRGIIRYESEKFENKEEVTNVLNNIDINYYNLNYNECIHLIIEFIENNKAKINISDTILNAYKNISEVSIKENNSRYFYEMRASQYYFGKESTKNVESIKRIGKYFQKKHKLGIPLEKIDSEDAAIRVAAIEETVYAISEGEDKINKFDSPKILEYYLKYKSKLYPNKGRLPKEGTNTRKTIIRKDKLSDHPDKMLPSLSRGPMERHMMIYRDELAEKMQFNRPADLSNYSKSLKKWPLNNQKAAYINSISGHVYFLTGMLKEYMEKHKHVTDLSEDINIFFRTIIALYLKKGFHSAHEVISVLNDKPVKEFFGKYGVILDLNFPYDVLSNAMEHTFQYTSEFCYKKHVHAELLEKFNSKQKIIPSFTQKQYNFAIKILKEDRRFLAKNATPAAKKAAKSMRDKTVTDEERFVIANSYIRNNPKDIFSEKLIEAFENKENINNNIKKEFSENTESPLSKIEFLNLLSFFKKEIEGSKINSNSCIFLNMRLYFLEMEKNIEDTYSIFNSVIAKQEANKFNTENEPLADRKCKAAIELRNKFSLEVNQINDAFIMLNKNESKNINDLAKILKDGCKNLNNVLIAPKKNTLDNQKNVELYEIHQTLSEPYNNFLSTLLKIKTFVNSVVNQHGFFSAKTNTKIKLSKQATEFNISDNKINLITI